MTGDEMQTAIEFILNQQAKVTVNLEILTERVDRLTERVDKIAETQENYNQSLVLLVQLARSSNERLDNVNTRMDETDERIRNLALSQDRTEESIKNLTASQARTDERLNKLGDTVDRYISNGRSGS